MEWRNMMQKEQVVEMAKRMRLKALDLAYAAGKTGAHLGGALSAVEILAALYGGVARVDAKDPGKEERDRILIGKAHCVLAYYTALYEIGYLTEEELNMFEQDGAFLTGHPQKDVCRGIEYAGGSLGMALSVGAGMALHAKRRAKEQRVYVLLGDGECEEGAVWESMLFASKYRLDNLIAIIDRNHLQSDGSTLAVAGLDRLSEKAEAFGWKAVCVDGHDVGQLMEAYCAGTDGRPLAVIADTVKGKGVSFMENDPSWHHAELNEELYRKARREVEEEDGPCRR